MYSGYATRKQWGVNPLVTHTVGQSSSPVLTQIDTTSRSQRSGSWSCGVLASPVPSATCWRIRIHDNTEVRFLVAQGVYLYGVFRSVELGYRLAFPLS